MQKPTRAAYSAAEFLDWIGNKRLVLSPKFQRRGVWQGPAKSFFLDSILRDMPVPPVYLRSAQSPEKDRVVREVIDGQQRISAVTAYMRNEFSLSKNLISTWAGKSFSELTEDEKDRIRNYSFGAEVFSGISDMEVLEIFSRLNTYATKLNDQELRNGKYFGVFKQLAYKLSLQYLEFWRIHGIFTERGIARMEEVELVSELLICAIDGLQDSKKMIGSYYQKYDSEFSDRDAMFSRIENVFNEIALASPDTLKNTEFNRRPQFYTLFAAIYHRLYGLPHYKTYAKGRRATLTIKDRESLADAMIILSDALSGNEDADDSNDDIKKYIDASQKHTDNIKQRKDRMDVLYSLAFA